MAHDLLLHVTDCPKCGVSLKAADQLAEEDLNGLPRAKPFLATVRRARSNQQLRLWWAMIRKVAQATPTPISEDALASWVKVRCGHVEYVPLGFGKSYAAPASIAFANMDQGDFQAFFNESVRLLLEEVAPGMPDGFADELHAMLDQPENRR